MVILCSGVVLLGKSLNFENTYTPGQTSSPTTPAVRLSLNTEIFEYPQKFQVYPYFLIQKFHSCVWNGQAKIDAGKNF